MAKFQNGNQASKGVTKGKTGRKSAYEEFRNAQEHYKGWTIPQDVKELEKRILSKKYSVWDVFLLRALKSDPRILSKFADKILPDLSMIMGPDGESAAPDLVGEARKRSSKYHPKPAK